MSISTRLLQVCIMLLLFAGVLPDLTAQNSADNKVPDFGFINTRGERLNLSGMQDKYVYINFWASWCPTFALMEPYLLNLEQRYAGKTFTNAEGLEVINISLDTSVVAWKQALEKYGGGVKNEVIATDGFTSSIAQAYGVTHLTTSFFVGPGNQFIGKNMKYSEIEQLLNSGAMVEEVYYRVFLAVLNAYAEPFHSFDHVLHLGRLIKEPNKNNTFAYYLGDYYSYTEAQAALRGAKDIGYQDASIVTYKSNIVQPVEMYSKPGQQGNATSPGKGDVGTVRSGNQVPPVFVPPGGIYQSPTGNQTRVSVPPSNTVRYLLPPEFSQKTPASGAVGLSAQQVKEITDQLQQIRLKQQELKAELQKLEKMENDLNARLSNSKVF